MEPTRPFGSSLVFGSLDVLLRIARFGSGVILAFAVLLVPYAALGINHLTLAGTTNQPVPGSFEPGEYQFERSGEVFGVGETTRFESTDGEVTHVASNVTVDVSKDRRAFMTLMSGFLVVDTLLLFLIFDSLVKVVSSTKAGFAFTQRNFSLLMRAGILCLTLATFDQVIKFTARYFVGQMEFSGPDFTLDFGLDIWTWLFGGLLLIAFSEVFAKGIELRRLEEATI